MTSARKLPQAPRHTLTVTQEMIDYSVPADSGHCMVAEAVKSAVPNATYVSVDLQTIRYSDPSKGLRYTYLTPRTVAEALCAWDEGVKPEPWSFQLRGGQVTRSGSRSSKYAGGRRKDVDRERDAVPVHSELHGDGTKGVPEVVGGRTPPMSALGHASTIKRNRRRRFGMRALDRQPPGETLWQFEQKDGGRS